MRVVFVIGQLARGGAERQLARLAGELARRRIEVHVVCFSPRPDGDFERYRMPNVPVHFVPRRAGRAVALVSAVALIQRLKPTVVHSMSFHLNFAAWAGARAAGAVAFGGIRGDFVSEMAHAGRWQGALCARFPKTLISNNHAAAGRARGHALVGEVEVVENAIDPSDFPTPANLQSTGPVRIVGVGNLHAPKRWQWAIEALAAAVAAGTDARLTIFGEGPERVYLEALAQRLAVAERFELPGNVPDVTAALPQFQLLLHPSELEGSPNAVLEGMAAGLACVASRAGDVEALLPDESLGYAVTRYEEFCERVLFLCRNHAVRQQLGANARRRALGDYAVATVVDRLVRLYGGST